MNTSEICSNDTERRRKIREHKEHGHADRNGIDYIEVDENDQHLLHVHFMDRAPVLEQAKNNFSAANVCITGGRRIRNIKVKEVRVCQPEDEEQPDCMEVVVDKIGDFSTYTLCLVEVDEAGHSTTTPLKGFDARYVCLDFSFKANCPSDLDCVTSDICPPAQLVEPEMNYLAKDYSSFRQLILDRLSLIMPGWQERHIPDIGITLVEILAYTGDYVSYYQDAVATEAYLETARQRISVRRHTRLVDYAMHEGCNARTWLYIQTSGDIALPTASAETYFITGYNDALQKRNTILTDDDLRDIPASNYEVFEPLLLAPNPPDTIHLYEAHNVISFYTWGEQECCLPGNATSASLKDTWITPLEPPTEQKPTYQPTGDKAGASKQDQAAATTTGQAPSANDGPRVLDNLHVGDVLIFEEVLGPKTANASDANPKHRHAVRLTAIERIVDDLYKIPIVEITWGEEDKLPFPLCLSVIGPAPNCQLLTDISVARGNIILVDYGQTLLPPENLDIVQQAVPPVDTCDECNQGETTIVAELYRPHLEHGPLTFSEPLPVDAPFFLPTIPDPPAPVAVTSASRLLLQDPRNAVPALWLTSVPPGDGSTLYVVQPSETESDEEDEEDEREVESDNTTPETPRNPVINKEITWTVRRDLLESHGEDHDVVIEMDNEGIAHLRFGDDELGSKPIVGEAFTARYRVGNGLRGNVGAESISHIVLHNTRLSGIVLQPRNPFAVSGGTDPEPLAEIKLFAPHAFRSKLERAITADDYARLAERNPKVQRAAAVLRWTGSWYEVLVAIDQVSTEDVDPALLDQVAAELEHYRRIGHDLKVVAAHYVALDTAMTICVQPHYLRGHVKAALLDVFSNRILADGRRGFFYPDNHTFGEGIALSKLVATAQAVTGVQSVTVTKLEHFLEGPNGELEKEFLPLGPMEIAQLDSDPSFPEHGKLTLKMVGGR